MRVSRLVRKPVARSLQLITILSLVTLYGMVVEFVNFSCQSLDVQSISNIDL